MSFDSMSRELATWIPSSDIFLARNLINEAWRKVQDEREWSFLRAEGTLYSPAIVTAGSATTTQFLTTVTLNATASAAVLPFTTPTIAATSPLYIGKRQFRMGTSGTIYSILTADITNPAAIVLTLDRLFTESTSTGSYQIFRAYYEPVDGAGNPVVTFKYWLAIALPTYGYTIEGRRLYMTQEEVKRVDPQHASQGQPYWCASYKADPSNNYAPLYELWPTPTFSCGMPTLYVRRAPDFSAAADTVPYQISERLLIAKGLSCLAEWAEMNKGIRPELQRTNWLKIKQSREAEYQAQLARLKKEDNAQVITNWLAPLGCRSGWPIADSNFWQSHSVGANGGWLP